MPLIFITFTSLIIWGFLNIPSWLQEVLGTFLGFFIICAVIGFVRQLFRNKYSFGMAQQTSLNQGTSEQPASAKPPSPVQQDLTRIRRDAEEAALTEDEFFRDHN